MNHSIAVVCDTEKRPHIVASFHRHAPSSDWDWLPSHSRDVTRDWKRGGAVPADGPQVVFESGQGHLTARLQCSKCRDGRDLQVRLERLEEILAAFAARRREQVTLAEIEQALRERHG